MSTMALPLWEDEDKKDKRYKFSPSCMSTMALHHQASASSPAETEPFAGLHSDGISICDVGLGWWAIRRKDVHFATVCQVMSIKREKFCTQMVSRSVMRDYEMISR